MCLTFEQDKYIKLLKYWDIIKNNGRVGGAALPFHVNLFRSNLLN